MLNSKVRDHVQTSLQGIANKARQDEKYRFFDVYRLINRISLMDAWYDLNKNAATGVDAITAAEYEDNLIDNIKELERRLKENRYRAKLVKRVYIEKGEGKFRPLGILVLEDKLVQIAAAKILGAIFDTNFLPVSYGYRPGIGPKDAVKDITLNLMIGRYSYIVDADIKGYFDKIDHEWLIKMLELRINDKRFIRLIKKWLKAGVIEYGKVLHPIKGTPQGGSVSPILANIYLHYALDLWVERVIKPKCEGQIYLCRFADDFICAFQYKREAEEFYKALKERLGKFKLELSEEKSKIISFSRFRKYEKSYFEFLGFEFRWGTDIKGKDRIKRRTSRKRFKKSIANFLKWIRENRNKRLRNIFKKLNAKLRGYYNYYGIIGNWDGIYEFFSQVLKLIYKWLNRRSQRRSFNYIGFGEMLKHYKIEKPRITEKRNQLLKQALA